MQHSVSYLEIHVPSLLTYLSQPISHRLGHDHVVVIHVLLEPTQTAQQRAHRDMDRSNTQRKQTKKIMKHNAR